MKRVLVLAAAVMLLVAAAGCQSSIDWSSVKNDDVVANYNGTEITKREVSFKYAIDYAAYQSASSMYEQLGVDGEELKTEMDDSLGAVIAYAVLADMAAQEGLDVSYDEAYDKAYDEYIVAAKKYDYLADFSEGIKSMLYLSDELLVERAAELYVLKNSAEAFLDKQFKDSIDSYEDFDSLKAGVYEQVKKLVADKTATVLYPNKHTVKCSDIDFEEIVRNSSWSYSSEYTLNNTDAEADAEG